MDKEILFLRICYWIGAIMDALAGIEMLCSALLGNMSPFTGLGLTLEGGSEYRYAMAIAGTFMIVWTFILLWADRKPIERRDILVILVPVIIGIQLSEFLGVSLGILSLHNFIINSILRINLLIFVIFSYLYSIYHVKSIKNIISN